MHANWFFNWIPKVNGPTKRFGLYAGDISTFLMNSLTAEYSESGSTKRLQKTDVMAYYNRHVEEREDSCEYHVSANLNQNW